jgi:hypothetical protein
MRDGQPSIGTGIVPFPGTPSVKNRGWHGMTAGSQKRYSSDDWKTWGSLAIDQARLAHISSIVNVGYG